MANLKKIESLTDYKGVLPYDSSLLGVYQPLLGWKSKLAEYFFIQKSITQRSSILQSLMVLAKPIADLQLEKVEIGEIDKSGKINQSSILMQKISEKLPDIRRYKNEIWKNLITNESITEILKAEVLPIIKDKNTQFIKLQTERVERQSDYFSDTHSRQLENESKIAKVLLILKDSDRHDELKHMFYRKRQHETAISEILDSNSIDSSLQSKLKIPWLKKNELEAVLSPISIVHLFRHYYFELDTFLGTPVDHVWLSPGSFVELEEIQTTKDIIEREIDSEYESELSKEKTLKEIGEFSEELENENNLDISFGASVEAKYSSITASADFDYKESQKESRKESHKRTREKSEKVSSKLRRKYKTKFRSVSEYTETNRKRYQLRNDTDYLVNYELRRKMRQIAVQVQDIGSYLCWQTFVDDPGRTLGVGKLVHIAEPADLSSIPKPEMPIVPGIKKSQLVVTIPFIPMTEDTTEDDRKEDIFEKGVESEGSRDFLEGEPEKIQWKFKETVVSPEPGYELIHVKHGTEGGTGNFSIKIGTPSKTKSGSNELFSYVIPWELLHVEFGHKTELRTKFNLHWQPTQAIKDKYQSEYEKKLKDYDEKKSLAQKKAFFDAARERINYASDIEPRKERDLREEERSEVYRNLIDKLVTANSSTYDTRHKQHIYSEVIKSIFDIDKMLYYVAPDWWVARKKYSIGFDKTKIGSDTVKLDSTSVGWGGIKEDETDRNNYYITEKSTPAKLGSSLGWLLQLDGDNRRNAFLNSPWVKAVIPIRPGKEEAAIDMLKEVEGDDGLDAIVGSSNQTLEQEIRNMAKIVKKKHDDSFSKDTYPKGGPQGEVELVDEDTTVTSTPIDRVYEHGFYPLKNSFKIDPEKNFEIFDQWIEIVPTDQIVAVEVSYDPKTGRQK